MQYRYLFKNAGGSYLTARGTVGTLDEAARLIKTGQWVLSWPVMVWCRQGTEDPDISMEPTGLIEDPTTKAEVPKVDSATPLTEPHPDTPPVPKKPRKKKASA